MPIHLGGPLGEFFHILMQAICGNNNLFCGPITARSVCHNVPELMKKTFFHVGAMIALSLIHGGPPPVFFSEVTADYILQGIRKPCISSIPDAAVRDKLMKVYIYTHYSVSGSKPT